MTREETIGLAREQLNEATAGHWGEAELYKYGSGAEREFATKFANRALTSDDRQAAEFIRDLMVDNESYSDIEIASIEWGANLEAGNVHGVPADLLKLVGFRVGSTGGNKIVYIPRHKIDAYIELPLFRPWHPKDLAIWSFHEKGYLFIPDQDPLHINYYKKPVAWADGNKAQSPELLNEEVHEGLAYRIAQRAFTEDGEWESAAIQEQHLRELNLRLGGKDGK